VDASTLDVGGVNWIWFLLVAAVFVAGALAIAAVRVAAEADRMRDADPGAEPYELHLLATMAGVAHAGSVEIVLLAPGRFPNDGVVVTGSALPRGRVGARVVPGEGLAGRVLATGRTALDGSGEAMAAPIGEGPSGVVSAVVAVDGPRFGPAQVARLEALAADVGVKLGATVSA
jgi:hypothetical protein